MSRFDHSRGRFFDDRAEVRNIDDGMAEYQRGWGTTVDWWVLVPPGAPDTDTYTYFYTSLYNQASASVLDDIYDEGEDELPGGKDYRPVYNVPVLSAQVEQGSESTDDRGLSSYDQMTLRLSYDLLERSGVTTDLITSRDRHLLDRFVYRNKVFDITTIVSAGHISAQTDLVVLVRGSEMRDDELQDSPQFSRYGTPVYDQPPYAPQPPYVPPSLYGAGVYGVGIYGF